jgi:protein-S-isoprenylcysteine O-methyltransferase Ste14
VSLPAAGWFPDPQDATRLRWWDGHVWGDATRPAPGRQEALARPVVAAPAGPSFSVRAPTGSVESRSWAYGTSVRRFCLFGFLSVVLAVASIIENPWGGLSVLAALFGVVGVVRPRGTGGWRVLGRSVSASAIVLAITTGIIAANELLHLF